MEAGRCLTRATKMTEAAAAAADHPVDHPTPADRRDPLVADPGKMKKIGHFLPHLCLQPRKKN